MNKRFRNDILEMPFHFINFFCCTLAKCCSAFPRKFYVADSDGNPILEGVESSSWCGRLCAEKTHAFEIDFQDADGSTVLSMEKNAACSTFYCCNAPVGYV